MKIEALRELLTKATPRPWVIDVDGMPAIDFHVADNELIVAAVNALPALLDVVEAAKYVLAHPSSGCGTGCRYCSLADALSCIEALP